MNIKNLLVRLHIFIGLFFGPFIFIAALSGALYAFTFATENWVYKDILISKNAGSAMQPLALQIEAANIVINGQGEFFSVRIAPEQSTRVLYLDKSLASSQYRTIFINPYTLEVKADLITYGSGGAMPARMWVDIFHRDLLLGKLGRFYSELAASWMWMTAVTGIILFATRRKKVGNNYQRLLNKHTSFGLFSFVALIVLSITGLTWSEWAGGNISKLRTQMNWLTPSLITKVENQSLVNYDLKMFDSVLSSAKASGLKSDYIEIKSPKKAGEIWQVAEIDRSYPTKIDAVSIDPNTLKVVDRLEFKKFPLMAKLTRWGIDIHMGTLFGFINQILVGLMSLSICALVFTGYKMWIQSHGWKFKNTLYKELKKLPSDSIILMGCILLPVALFMPLVLAGLIVFVPLEEMLSRRFNS